jgi:hypothetical protein
MLAEYGWRVYSLYIYIRENMRANASQLGLVEKLSAETEEERFLIALGEDVSTLILVADPSWDGQFVEELFTTIHEELFVVACATG